MIAEMVTMNADQFNDEMNEEQIYGKKKTAFSVRCIEKLFGIRETRLSKVLTDNKRVELIEAEKNVMNAKVFQRFITTAEKQENAKSTMSSAQFDSKASLPKEDELEENIYCIQELIEMNPRKLSKMTFEVKSIGGQEQVTAPYVKINTKTYQNNNQTKQLVKIIDVTQNILYEQVFAENEFLSITNATVSHELRNPL